MAFKGSQFVWADRKRYLGMPLSFTRYGLSEDRLFLSVGFFSVRDEEILLYRVRDISVRRSLWQRLLGVGTIIVSSSDKSTPTLPLVSIKNPLEVKELLHENVEIMKIRRRMRIGESMTTLDQDDDGSDDDLDIEEEI
jgi:hypothetical protein